MREIPKSITLRRPSPANSRLPGLMSRWVTPSAWAPARASSSCSTMPPAALASIPASFGSTSSSERASTNSITKNGSPSCEPKSYIATMLACRQRAAACTSLRNRDR